jgi:4-hydroxy-4-methyl-2-oxoglutarate aldolase
LFRGSFSTAGISDALDRLGLDGQALGIAPLERAFRCAGPAFTVRMAPVGAVKGNVGDYVDDVALGSVVVIDNGGRLDCTVWGDLLTTRAHQRALAGTLINGVCRDVARSIELKYPLFTRGAYMRTGKDRVQVEAFSAPVSLGSVRVEPGDWVIGDADGVILVAQSRAAEVLKLAQEIEAAEDQIRNAIEAGMRLDEARKRFGYHTLQRRAK